MHLGTEWLRQVDINQDHYAGVLSAYARWVQDFHTWARAMGHFRAALAARWLPAPRTPPAATWCSPVFSVARVYFRIIIRIRSVSPWLTKRWRGLASRILPLARS